MVSGTPTHSSPRPRRARPLAAACLALVCGRPRPPAQPTRWSSPICSTRPASDRLPLRAGSLIWTQISPSVLPSQAISRGARCQNGIARHPPRLEVGRLMANRTSHRRQAEAVGAPFDRRLMKSRRVALARAVPSGMAIETAGAGQHLAELSKISGRPRSRIADRRKALDAGEIV